MIDASNFKVKTKKILPLHSADYIEEFCFLQSWKLFVTLSRSFEVDRQVVEVYSLPSFRQIRTISFPAFRYETEFKIQFTPDQSALVIFAHMTILLFLKEDLIVGVPSIVQHFSNSRQLKMLKNNCVVELRDGVTLYKPWKKKFVEVLKKSELEIGFSAQSIEYIETRDLLMVTNVSRSFNNTLNEGLFALLSVSNGKIISKFSFQNAIPESLPQIRPFQLLGASNRGETIVLHVESRDRSFFIVEMGLDEGNVMRVTRVLSLPHECTIHAKFLILYEDFENRSYFLKHFSAHQLLRRQIMLVPMSTNESQNEKGKFIQLKFPEESQLRMMRTNGSSTEFLHLDVEIFSLFSVSV